MALLSCRGCRIVGWAALAALVACSSTSTPGEGIVVVTLVTGDHHSCGRLKDGRIACWGSNEMGQLGDGTGAEHASPTLVPGLDNAMELVTGANHTCIRQGDRSVRCWGDNSHGQLGDGTHTRRPTPVKVPDPCQVAGVAAGGDTTCVWCVDGAARCWGANDRGQLGDGTRTEHASPVEPIGLATIAEVVVGRKHVCARFGDRKVACWGANDHGQVGESDLGATEQPSRTTRDAPPLQLGATPITDLQRALAVAQARRNGSAAVELNFDRKTSRPPLPANPPAPPSAAPPPSAPSPPIAPPPPIALPRPSVLPSFAPNLAAAVERPSAAPTAPPQGSSVKPSFVPNLAAAVERPSSPAGLAPAAPAKPALVSNLAALAEKPSPPSERAGSSKPQLVRAPSRVGEDQLVPSMVRDLGAAVQIALGEHHSCARLLDWTAKCWGQGTAGALGNGGAADASAPVPVKQLQRVEELVAAGSVSCVRLEERKVLCWGTTSDGLLGDGQAPGAAATHNTPFAIPDLPSVNTIAVGPTHACVRLSDHRVRCWGRNSHGELGDGTHEDHGTPTDVSWGALAK